ncbi:hypothetical protein BJ742DRAFT_769376 [Cladochytrium replicatum]|nr:hypothetical protein BJ742DRAFT_769376 [Cladochytrium replicatum]
MAKRNDIPLNGKQVLIFGITGNIGLAAVSGLLDAALISPSHERLKLVKVGRRSKAEGKVELGRFGYVIASIGPWQQTPKRIASVTTASLHALSRTIAVQHSDNPGGVLEMVLHRRVEDDQMFGKMHPNAKGWSDNDATHSSVFR